MALRAAFPSGPLTDSDGNLSAAWRGFFQSLYSRTGAANGVDTAAAIEAEIAQERSARMAADLALQGGIISASSAGSDALQVERTARIAADAVLLPKNGGVTGTIGFQGAVPIARPTVTGAKGGNAALASLLSALATYGLITDSST